MRPHPLCSVAASGLAAASEVLPRHSAPGVMGGVAVLALLANVGIALLLYRFRSGVAIMRSVWICSRIDAIGNVAVTAAAAGVLGTASPGRTSPW